MSTSALLQSSFLLQLLLQLLHSSAVDAEDRSGFPPPCDSFIYCQGPLLDAVQMNRLFKDSKTFVDMKMRWPPAETLRRFELLTSRSRADIERFVADNFEPEGSEFEEWTPDDWGQRPGFLAKIRDESLREWAAELHRLWLMLGRKMKARVRAEPDLYSIIYVDNPVIVPGGRFREFYYWDSYWIFKGLLLSEMPHTVRGMLSNFLQLVDVVGHIPNGGRVYYKMRSQPPLLIPMMELYVDATGDRDFLRRSMPALEKEFTFWMTNHTVEVQRDGKIYNLARYGDGSRGPRPESYREDVESASSFSTPDTKEAFWAELRAGAESGWDYSTRWFVLNGTNRGNLTALKTRSILPVDLNAILCWNARLLQQFHEMLGNEERARHYERIANDWTEAIDKILWHEEIGSWLDYDIHNAQRRDYFYPSNVSPLWAGSYDKTKTEYYVSRVLKYLDNAKVDNYAGGIPTSLEHSGEQWDYPNAWAPLQHIVVSGLRSTGVPAATRLAYEWATRWIRSNYIAWQEMHAMFEKYDATIAGGHGGGGEYEIQLGFGWSNSVIMDFLDMYGDRVTAVDQFDTTKSNIFQSEDIDVLHDDVSTASVSTILTAVLAVLASFAAGLLG